MVPCAYVFGPTTLDTTVAARNATIDCVLPHRWAEVQNGGVGCGSRKFSRGVFNAMDDCSTAEDATVERLLERITNHPCVYNVKRLDYCDAERQANAWEAIWKQCGLATGKLHLALNFSLCG
ncbi:hypothetical protein HPB50_017561 [Hyalomma asiaticum]|uniref:Uncharacterized protein n=1 Tax=Hyalomma asiaticum TaxID=266040 RepID=A0ACB7SMN7_HYAAI|nr:hypothetical protein HPB50_017561 [Hyalomma asiaticum]